MRIVKSVQTKVCVDGSLMKEFVLDEPLSAGFLEFLSHFGTVKQYPHMKRPYFSFEQEHFISIRGFEGEMSVEVRYTKEFQDLTGDYFHLLLFYSGGGEKGLTKMKDIRVSIGKNIETRLPSEGNNL